MTAQNPFNEFTKAFQDFQTNPFDLSSLVDAQQKNAKALTQASQIAVESMQTIAQKQSEFISQMVSENSKMAKEIMGEGTPEQKASKNARLVKAVYERSFKNAKEISDVVNKTNDQAAELLNKCVVEMINGIEKSVEKSSRKAA